MTLKLCLNEKATFCDFVTEICSSYVMVLMYEPSRDKSKPFEPITPLNVIEWTAFGLIILLAGMQLAHLSVFFLRSSTVPTGEPTPIFRGPRRQHVEIGEEARERPARVQETERLSVM